MHANTCTLIRNADLLPMAGPQGTQPLRVDLLVRDGQIAAIGTALPAPVGCEVIDGRGKLVMPGLINAHTHSSETFFKGRYEGMHLETWLLYAYTYLGGSPVGERLLYLRTLALALQSLRCGVTTLCDDFFDPMAHNLDRISLVFQAYADAGIRANVSNAVLNTPVLDSTPFGHSTFPAHLAAQLRFGAPITPAEYASFCSAVFAQWHGSAQGRLRFSITPSAPQRCTTDMLQTCHALAVQYGVPLHTHLLETRVQAVAGQMFYGKTLLAHMHDIGILDRHTTLAHAIWLTHDDIERMGSAQCTVVHNPLSNLKLGSGRAPVRQLMRAGVPLGLGTDGLSSNDSARVFDLMRFAALMHNGPDAAAQDWPQAAEVLKMATIDGARTAMLDGVTGSLEVGKAADLLMLDLNNDNFRPLNDIAKQLVYCEDGSSVELVMVAGEIVCRHGNLLTVDEAAVWTEIRELLPAYLQDHARWEQTNQIFEPYFTEIIARCKHVDLADLVSR